LILLFLFFCFFVFCPSDGAFGFCSSDAFCPSDGASGFCSSDACRLFEKFVGGNKQNRS
jgi:hypothetical protein